MKIRTEYVIHGLLLISFHKYGSCQLPLAAFLFIYFAEKAFREDGNLKQAKELSINKVGHGLYSSILADC